MKQFFFKIKNGIRKILLKIKNIYINLKDKTKNMFVRIRNKNNKNQKNSEIDYKSISSNENIKNVVNKTRVRNNASPEYTNVKYKITGEDTIIVKNNKTRENKETVAEDPKNKFEDLKKAFEDTKKGNNNDDKKLEINRLKMQIEKMKRERENYASQKNPEYKAIYEVYTKGTDSELNGEKIHSKGIEDLEKDLAKLEKELEKEKSPEQRNQEIRTVTALRQEYEEQIATKKKEIKRIKRDIEDIEFGTEGAMVEKTLSDGTRVKTPKILDLYEEENNREKELKRLVSKRDECQQYLDELLGVKEKVEYTEQQNAEYVKYFHGEGNIPKNTRNDTSVNNKYFGFEKTMGDKNPIEPVGKNQTNKESKYKTLKDRELGSKKPEGKDNAQLQIIEINEGNGNIYFTDTKGNSGTMDIITAFNFKKETLKKLGISKMCREIVGGRLRGFFLKRKLNPEVLAVLDKYPEQIKDYIESINNKQKVPFDLVHNLENVGIFDKLKVNRYVKAERKTGAKVRETSLTGRMSKKIKRINQKPKEINEIEKEVLEDAVTLVDTDKKSKKEEKLIQKEKKRLDKKEFKERYKIYAALIEKLYGLKPRRKLDEIENNIIDRDLYNLTNKDEWERAIATFNVGYRLSMINPKEAKNYLSSAYKQFNSEKLLEKNKNVFQYLEDTLLNLQEIYIRESDFKKAMELNNEYMKVVEREKREKLSPLYIKNMEKGEKIKAIDLAIEYRKKYVAGQKTIMKILYKSGNKFEAEELYRKILNESGIVLTDEAYDLSIEENCIENGKYIVINNGITYREPILGTEKYLSLRNRLKKQLVKDKPSTNIEPEPVKAKPSTNIEPEPVNVKPSTNIEPEPVEVKPSTNIEPKSVKVKPNTNIEPEPVKAKPSTNIEPEPVKVKPNTNIEESSVNEDKKKIGIFAKTREIIENITKEIKEKEEQKRIEEERQRKIEEEQKRIEEEKQRKFEEEQKRIEEERQRKIQEEQRKLEEKRKVEQADFNKRYKDYKLLAKGLVSEIAKENIEDIKEDMVHKDIYDMTSEDEAIKGVATFRVGHKLAMLPTKKNEAERLLKTSISILKKGEVLSKDDSLIEILQDAYLDLGNFYTMNNNYIDAEKSFVNYMETVKKEKIEKYDPKIIEAKKKGRIIDEIDLWMDVKAKFTTGKKSMIKLLSKSGKEKEAEELYRKLLDDCKISLTDEEYKLSVDTNCIENGQYMRITKERTYREPILGNEYLLLKRKSISNNALSSR